MIGLIKPLWSTDNSATTPNEEKTRPMSNDSTNMTWNDICGTVDLDRKNCYTLGEEELLDSCGRTSMNISLI